MRRARGILRGCFLLVCLGVAGSGTHAAAQTTVYVPFDDPAYADLDLLMARGWASDAVTGERPYSRATFARLVRNARRRLSACGGCAPGARVTEALERLAARFLHPGEEGELRVRPPSALQVRLEGTEARSPWRQVPDFVNNAATLQADLNPLLERNGGRMLADGSTLALEVTGAVERGRLAVLGRPRVSALEGAHPRAGSSGFSVTDAYARTVWGVWALDVGRNHASVGHGLDGGPLLSWNARGLDQIRFSMERPLRLPGPFSALGGWQTSAIFARMDDDRYVDGSVLSVFRLSGRPAANVEFGINYLNLQGGEGAPDATLPQRLVDIFFFWVNGGYYQISDKVVGADLLVRVPSAGAELYVNFLTTDDRGRFQQPAGGYWEDALWSVGTRVLGFGKDGRWDAALEWVHAGPMVHLHGQFRSGLTVDRRLLGNPLGPNAWSWSAVLAYQARNWRLSARGSWEHYSGDVWKVDLLPTGDPWDFEWFRLEENPDEVRRRVRVAWQRRAPETRLRLHAVVGWEHVRRFDYTERSRHNALAQLRAEFALF